MKFFFHNLIFFVSVLLLSLTFLCIVLALFGFRPFILDSASMEPLYKEGDFILADTKVTTNEVRPGDVLIYRSENGALVMHRLIAQNTFRGDANQSSEHVNLDDANLIGKVTFAASSPVFAFCVENRTFSLILVIAFLILSCFIWKPDRHEKNSGKKELMS